ncbi:MAG: DNA polymerase/3'-5' exonuclease PolX, partial [Bacteroidetes bacterium]
MTNKEIANAFKYLADLMELHQENPFKIKSYRNAYLLIRKWPTPLEGLSESELSQLKGIGKAISSKIVELTETGTLKTIQKYEAMTPEGVREILKVPGIGPKKVRVLWKELG